MNFRELLKSHGLGIRALSAKTNLSHNCLQRLIAEGNCTVQTIVRLSEGMLIPPCVILDALIQTRQSVKLLPESETIN
jgi:hypothetical protein